MKLKLYLPGKLMSQMLKGWRVFVGGGIFEALCQQGLYFSYYSFTWHKIGAEQIC